VVAPEIGDSVIHRIVLEDDDYYVPTEFDIDAYDSHEEVFEEDGVELQQVPVQQLQSMPDFEETTIPEQHDVHRASIDIEVVSKSETFEVGELMSREHDQKNMDASYVSTVVLDAPKSDAVIPCISSVSGPEESTETPDQIVVERLTTVTSEVDSSQVDGIVLESSGDILEAARTTISEIPTFTLKAKPLFESMEAVIVNTPVKSSSKEESIILQSRSNTPYLYGLC
jgi:hypothetical protein